MVLPDFDSTAYDAQDKDDSWTDTNWCDSSAYLTKTQHRELVALVEANHGKSFAKDVTWGQILENNDLPHDNTELVDNCHKIVNSWMQTKPAPVEAQMEVDVVEVAAMIEEGPGPEVLLKPSKSVRKKRRAKT